ncbi:uncharacterized protein LOC118787736, partial [Megalops cyprinoides]|uniref:uncharacterized protein LOC118787736 n=1 Tax=Megalops cyprinoides TaxID=118141 RepID=UPI0018655E94
MSQLTVTLLLFLGSGALASHFYGGTMTFNPKGQDPDGSYRVDFRFKEAYAHMCYPWNSWLCSSGDCGSLTNYAGGEIDSMTAGNQWCQFEGFFTRHISSNLPFEMRVPQNCPNAINLMAHDPDGDHVRCRYGQNFAECGSCYQQPDFHMDQDTCTIFYNSSSVGVYIFELVLEDFPRQQILLSYTDGSQSVKSPLSLLHPATQSFTTTVSASSVSPISKIPLQFAVQVDGSVPSCTEGLYLPRFLYPTPHNGDFLNVSLGHDLEIRIKAGATHSQLSEFIISGPLNITETQT